MFEAKKRVSKMKIMLQTVYIKNRVFKLSNLIHFSKSIKVFSEKDQFSLYQQSMIRYQNKYYTKTFDGMESIHHMRRRDTRKSSLKLPTNLMKSFTNKVAMQEINENDELSSDDSDNYDENKKRGISKENIFEFLKTKKEKFKQNVDPRWIKTILATSIGYFKAIANKEKLGSYLKIEEEKPAKEFEKSPRNNNRRTSMTPKMSKAVEKTPRNKSLILAKKFTIPEENTPFEFNTKTSPTILGSSRSIKKFKKKSNSGSTKNIKAPIEIIETEKSIEKEQPPKDELTDAELYSYDQKVEDLYPIKHGIILRKII